MPVKNFREQKNVLSARDRRLRLIIHKLIMKQPYKSSALHNFHDAPKTSQMADWLPRRFSATNYQSVVAGSCFKL